MNITKEMIGAAHDVMLRRGDFVLSARLIEEIYDAMRNKEPLENRELLEQQLAEREKQNVMLRDLIGHILNTYHVPMVPRIMEALAATADLAGLVVCDAVPIIFSDCQTEPLYRVRRTK